jgi:hypothetical protein
MPGRPPNSPDTSTDVHSYLGELGHIHSCHPANHTDFGRHLTQWVLASNEDITSTKPFPSLHTWLASLPLNPQDVLSSDHKDLDELGVNLWNVCCKVDRLEVDEKTKMQLAQGKEETSYVRTSRMTFA